MSSRAWRIPVSVVAIVLACAAWFGTPVAGQDVPKTPGPREIESDPIECRWRTDRSAVHVGEPFTLVLTCGVVETSRIRVVADTSRLDPMALELTPFEVVGGTRHKDIEAPPWRYFQYSYTVRLLSDEFFGRDVNVPSIQMTYSVQSVAGDGAPGREQLYVLPALPVRILSLVPAGATDIRDVWPETFADVEKRRFRSTLEIAAAGIFFAFAVVLAGLGVAGRYRSRAPAVARPLPLDDVLRGCVRETRELKSEAARVGWTPDLTGRALTVFRIAGAVALGRPVAQVLVDRRARQREGQLELRKGILRPKRALISAATTAAAVAGQLAGDNDGQSDPRTQATLEEIRDSLDVFSTAWYSRNGRVDAAALDPALDRGTRAVERLQAMNQWPVRAAGAFARAAARFRGAVWSR